MLELVLLGGKKPNMKEKNVLRLLLLYAVFMALMRVLYQEKYL